MFNEILVAYDGSDCSKKALAKACEMQEQNPYVKLHILTAFSLPANQMFSLYGPAITEEIVEQYENQARARLEEAEQNVGSEREGCTFHILRGDPANAILQYSEAHHIDLIIVGSRGLGAVKGMIMGSVSSRIVQQAHCNVLIIK